MKKSFSRDISKIALFAALLAVSAFIYIPLPVPITMQTLVMFLALFILGGKGGSIAVLIYISLGTLGLPIFSGFSGGIARLFDATGGFIFGMLIASLFWWLLDTVLPNKIAFKIVSSLSALLIIYLCGTFWFAFVYANGEKTFGTVLLTCVVPFVIPDILKLYLAHLISKRIPNP